MIFNEESCLAYNVFEGDFFNQDDIIFKDKIVTSRKKHECDLCGKGIKIKERIRYISGKFDGEVGTQRFCSKCCSAMVKSWKDDGKALEKRMELK